MKENGCRYMNLLCVLLLMSPIMAAIRSATGTLEVDSNGDGVAEAEFSGSDLLVSGEVHAASLSYQVQTVSTHTSLSSNALIIVDAALQDIDISLPPASNSSGRLYKIKIKSSPHRIHIEGGGGQIGQGTHLVVPPGEGSLEIASDGQQWPTMAFDVEPRQKL